MRKISRVLIGAVSLFLLPAAGEGEKVLAVLRQFGLVGTWSMRCANKASQENPHFAFGRSVGDFPIVIIGDGKNGSGGDIIDAQMVSPTKLRLKAKSDAGDVRTIEIVKIDKAIRFYHIILADGTFTVKDGKNVAGTTLQEMPLLEKCA